jgi:hypothetical protein
MHSVSTVNLSTDATKADVAIGAVERGPLRPDELRTLLEGFAQLESPEDLAAEPRIFVSAVSGRFEIRTTGRVLLLSHFDTPTEPGRKVSPAEIIAILTTPSVPRSRLTLRRTLAGLLLLLGLALNLTTFKILFRNESISATTVVVPLTEPAEILARHREALGTYATGRQPGDREIKISSDGTVWFIEQRGKTRSVLNTDTFQLGRRNNKFCLLTPESGVVDFMNPDTLLYFGDTYRRTE